VRLRKKPIRIGTLATVRSLENSYCLPTGLPERATVKILHFDFGTVTVEFENQQFRVNMTCIDPGHEAEVDGKWLDENDRRVIKRRLAP
jgi:hypothetical protein